VTHAVRQDPEGYKEDTRREEAIDEIARIPYENEKGESEVGRRQRDYIAKKC
jgi:hypothetical protein